MNMYCLLLLLSVLNTVSAKITTKADVDIIDATRGQTSKLSVKVTDNNGDPVSGIVHIQSYYPMVKNIMIL
ncbi:hypothetical protein ALNOE001_20050 [Candidatus Methanobinarius endosymbioticus]|uniref:Uncharacterized protein n=1 Tax=Candidatus Methanobinarius endosymbioticus TaxID=2006182 RepID=A0A366M7X1_9EURY|nr:hypothetical protein ALNOE001_20050 [Candidatus Methanobinarius endosymbioticus]